MIASVVKKSVVQSVAFIHLLCILFDSLKHLEVEFCPNHNFEFDE